MQRQPIDPALVFWPPDEDPDFDVEDEAASFEQLSGSRSYGHLAGFGAEDLAAALAVEGHWMGAHGPADWMLDPDDLLYEQLADDVAPEVAGLDVGVVSAVIALSALGCVTATSCNGQPRHQYPVPMVVFWVRPGGLPAVHAAATAAGCQLSNGSSGSVVLTAPDVGGLLRFAAATQSALDQPAP